MTMLEIGKDTYLKLAAGRTRGNAKISATGRLVSSALVVLGLAIGAAVPAIAQNAGSAAGGGPHVLAYDTASTADPIPFWGQVECENGSRHEVIDGGGDFHPMANGAPQGDSSFRRLRVLDGDDFYGERCELGDNWAKGPTAFYREGRRRITALSLRPTQEMVNTRDWQVVMQMKQAQPSSNGGGSPALELQLLQGKWRLNRSGGTGLTDDSRKLWSWPARAGVWTRFSFDVKYSRSARKGRVKVIADVNGDGDYLDATERTRKRKTFTLKRRLNGRGSVPSHLRTGIYHNPVIHCPPPSGCQIDVDNVQVLAP